MKSSARRRHVARLSFSFLLFVDRVEPEQTLSRKTTKIVEFISFIIDKNNNTGDKDNDQISYLSASIDESVAIEVKLDGVHFYSSCVSEERQ
jgi:hypothetical protein